MNTTDSIATDSNSLRERILRASERLFYSKGYSTTRLDEIAREAGTSASGIVRLFDNKYGVLAALYDRAWATVNSQIIAALERCSGDPREKLLAVAVTVWRAYEMSRETVYPMILNTGIADMLILSSADQKTDSPQNLKYLDMVRGLCQECVQNGWVDKTCSANALREGMFGIIEGVLTGWYQEDWATSVDAFPNRLSVKEGASLISMLLYGRMDSKRLP